MRVSGNVGLLRLVLEEGADPDAGEIGDGSTALEACIRDCTVSTA